MSGNITKEITKTSAESMNDSELRDSGASLGRRMDELDKKMDWDTYNELTSVGKQKDIVDTEIKNRIKS